MFSSLLCHFSYFTFPQCLIFFPQHQAFIYSTSVDLKGLWIRLRVTISLLFEEGFSFTQRKEINNLSWQTNTHLEPQSHGELFCRFLKPWRLMEEESSL